MKSIKFNTQKIQIAFDTEQEAQAIYNWIPITLLQKDATVEGKQLTYDLTDYSDKFYPIKRLLRKIIYDSDDWEDELYSSAFSTDPYNYRLNCRVTGDNLLRVTPFNSDGTLGTLDFRPYQYIKGFSLIQLNKTNEIFFLSERGHVGDSPKHEVKLSDDRGVLIEVGTLQL